MLSGVAGDDVEWAARSGLWARHARSRKVDRRKRRPNREPLILAGHGVSLRIEAGTLLVRNGFTHYPQKQETYRYFKGDPDLPPRIIMLDGSGSVTFDVLTWRNEQKVPLVKIDWTSNAVTVISGNSFAANRDLRPKPLGRAPALARWGERGGDRGDGGIIRSRSAPRSYAAAGRARKGRSYRGWPRWDVFGRRAEPHPYSYRPVRVSLKESAWTSNSKANGRW